MAAERARDIDTDVISSSNKGVWVFGYGSLLWKPNFPYEDKVVGHIKGYKRRFWQGSFVHRGTPKRPGRVVTLMPGDPSDLTWGIAYKVQPENVPEVLDYLNKRENPERTGYTTHEIQFYPRDEAGSAPFLVMVYIGEENSSGYLGVTSIDNLVQQILVSKGESGCNTHYVLMLAKSVREMIAPVQTRLHDDKHLFSLEEKLLEKIRDAGQLRPLQFSTAGSGQEVAYCGMCIACIFQP